MIQCLESWDSNSLLFYIQIQHLQEDQTASMPCFNVRFNVGVLVAGGSP